MTKYVVRDAMDNKGWYYDGFGWVKDSAGAKYYDSFEEADKARIDKEHSLRAFNYKLFVEPYDPS